MGHGAHLDRRSWRHAAICDEDRDSNQSAKARKVQAGMKKTRFFILISMLMVPGCASTLASMASGQIGCPENEIEVLDHSPGLVSTTWVVACRGQRYYCSSVSGAYSIQASCSPQQRPTEARVSRPSAPAGCQHDGQCKGDRICQAGRCVDPNPDKVVAAKPSADSPAKAEPRPRSFAERKSECQGGNTELCLSLAKLIEQGQETPPDRTRPAELYEIACRAGSSAGCLGMMRSPK